MNATQEPPGGDEQVERALRDGLHAPVLTPEALQRIRRATEAEWRAHVTPVPARRRWWPAAAAAVVVAVSLGAVLLRLAPGASLGRLARTEMPGVFEIVRVLPDPAVDVGSELRVGQRVELRGASLVSLAAGGNLRVAPGSRLAFVAPETVRLERGEMYVDIPPGAAAASFIAVTEAGEFRHVGTQFSIAVIDGATRLRVREGSVRWSAANGDSTVDAGTELVIDGANQVTRRRIDTAGAEWTWVEALTPEILIEDRPLAEFLEWVARETGRRLVLADDQTRAQVAAIRMHGDVRGLSPTQALNVVMAATSLRFELPDGTIRVSLARAPAPASS